MKTTFIYALKEPDTGEIRYIGKANDPQKRLSRHLHGKGATHKSRWIMSLVSAGMTPSLEILDEVIEEHWQQWEVAFIEFFRELGCDLTNATLGGEGTSPSDETRKKMSAAKLGKKLSAEHKKKISAALLGNLRGVGRNPSLETRGKISAAGFGRRVSEETRRKISVASVGKIIPIETRIRISAARLGQKPSPETRRKLSAAQTARREREKAA